ncbi:hypothetical protein T5B8_07538 [Salinisphaera sp. T5B8]
MANKLIIHIRNETMRSARQVHKPLAPHFDRRKRQLQGFCKQLAVFIDRLDLGYIFRFRVSYFYAFQRILTRLNLIRQSSMPSEGLLTVREIA